MVGGIEGSAVDGGGEEMGGGGVRWEEGIDGVWVGFGLLAVDDHGVGAVAAARVWRAGAGAGAGTVGSGGVGAAWVRG